MNADLLSPSASRRRDPAGAGQRLFRRRRVFAHYLERSISSCLLRKRSRPLILGLGCSAPPGSFVARPFISRPAGGFQVFSTDPPLACRPTDTRSSRIRAKPAGGPRRPARRAVPADRRPPSRNTRRPKQHYLRRYGLAAIAEPRGQAGGATAHSPRSCRRCDDRARRALFQCCRTGSRGRQNHRRLAPAASWGRHGGASTRRRRDMP